MLRLLFYIFITGFLLNLFWEVVQAPLYIGYENFRNNFMMCFVASIIDAIVVLFLFSIFVAAYRNIYWIKNLSWSNTLLLIILGGLIAIGFEHWALTTGAWNYTDKMPVFFSEIGIFPLLQLMFLPLISFLIAKKLSL
jgi:hypothetical protein